MKSTYEILSVENAIKKLNQIKGTNKKVAVCIIDFDNDQEDTMMVTYKEGCKLIRAAKSIIHNGDEFIPHLELFSVIQNDVNNMIKKGVMHDILLPPKLE